MQHTTKEQRNRPSLPASGTTALSRAVDPEKESRWLQMLALAADWYWEQDASLQFTRFESLCGESLTGTDDKRLLHRTWWSLSDDVSAEALVCSPLRSHLIYKAQYERQLFRNMEAQCTLNGESLSWVRVSGAPRFDPHGAFVGYCGIARNITAYRNAENAVITQLSYYDELTGLANRRLLLQRLEEIIKEHAHKSFHAGILLFDFGNIKDVNNVLGHDWSERLLVEAAKRITQCASEAEIVSHHGENEFAVAFSKLSPLHEQAEAQARMVSERFVRELSLPYAINGNQLHCPPSVGVMLFRGSEFTADELLKYAGMITYRSGEDGINHVAFATPKARKSPPNCPSSITKAEEIRNNIARGEIMLHFQPIVDAQRKIVAAEALVRWRHPVHGLILPALFVPLVEQAGLIQVMGQQVLQMACKQLKQWAQAPQTRNLSISINVSAKEFRLPDFVDNVKNTVARYGINPRRLKLELTESLLLTGVDDAIQKMNVLRDIGIQFALDDFGTGYSSLAYLRRLPLSQIKMDKIFVDDIFGNENDTKIANIIITLAHTLNMCVVAEGVEIDAQFDTLKKNECDYFQGHLFGGPVPACAIATDLPGAPSGA